MGPLKWFDYKANINLLFLKQKKVLTFHIKQKQSEIKPYLVAEIEVLMLQVTQEVWIQNFYMGDNFFGF